METIWNVIIRYQRESCKFEGSFQIITPTDSLVVALETAFHQIQSIFQDGRCVSIQGIIKI